MKHRVIRHNLGPDNHVSKEVQYTLLYHLFLLK